MSGAVKEKVSKSPNRAAVDMVNERAYHSIQRVSVIRSPSACLERDKNVTN
jgi:hypothetical protein